MDKGWEEPSKSWGLKLISLLQDSLILLNDIVSQSEPFFENPFLNEEAKSFLKKDEVKECLKLIYANLNKNRKDLDSTAFKYLLDEISKTNKIKKGLLMRSLRMALFGSLSGPDLIQSWVLLSERDLDIERIKRCLA